MLHVKKFFISLILKVAPIALVESASILFWGEPEIPESLKDL